MPLTKNRSVILRLAVLGVVILISASLIVLRSRASPPSMPCIADCPPPPLTAVGPTETQPEAALGIRDGKTQVDDRYGVVATGDIDHALKLLGVQWWYSLDSSASGTTGSRVMLIATRSRQGVVTRDSLSHVEAMARSNPGSYWIIGNEPNVPGQDNVTPEQYVDEFRFYFSAIRGVDPTAKFVGPNVLNFDVTCSGCDGILPGGTWVKRFVAAWTNKTASSLPFDAWGIHAYSISWDNLPMVDSLTAEREIASFSDYLATLPTERSKPIWLTEFGVIWGFASFESQSTGCAAGSDCLKPTGTLAVQPIKSYLNQLLGWLSSSSDRYRIRRWFLYTTYGSPEPYATEYTGISLLSHPGPEGTLTTFGTLYRSYAARPN